jgi:hypothetical protein
MAFPKHVWDQLKAKTADELIAALTRDGYLKDPASRDATIAFVKAGSPNKRIVIHYHPRKSYGPKLLQGLLNDAGWTTEKDLAAVGLIKAGARKTAKTMLVPCHCEGAVSATGEPCHLCGGTRFVEVPIPPSQ